MNAQWRRLVGDLETWTDERVAVEVRWLPGLERLAHLSGVLGEPEVTEERDRWGDPQVRLSVPIGEAGWLVFSSHTFVEAEHHGGQVAVRLEDNLEVVVSNVGG